MCIRDSNKGTVFKITPHGVLTTLHSFDSTDGANPRGRLVQATDGNLYGTTWMGGAANAGTIFTITPVSYTHLDVYKRQAPSRG